MRFREAGFTLVEVLTVVLIISILAAIGIPALLGQRAKGWDAQATSALVTAGTTATTYYIDENRYPTTDAAAAAALTSLKEGSVQFVGYEDGDNLSTGPRVISVEVNPNGKQISLCARSKSDIVFCERRDDESKLVNVAWALPDHHVASLTDLVLPQASAASHKLPASFKSTPNLARSAADTEEEARCLLDDRASDSVCGYAGDGGSGTPDPDEDDNDPGAGGGSGTPTAPERAYEDEIAADAPSATCNFDETSPLDYTSIASCNGISGGGYRSDRNSYTLGEPGAIMTASSTPPGPAQTDQPNRSVRFHPNAAQSSQANSSALGIDNRSYTATVWVKPANNGANSEVINGDTKWSIRMAGTGFTCSHRSNTPNEHWVTTPPGGGTPQGGTWYLVACAYDRTTQTLQLIVNGQNADARTNVTPGASGNPNLNMGWSNDHHPRLDGHLDQFAFYGGKALTAEDVARHYNAAGY